jgi:hypothetical protein
LRAQNEQQQQRQGQQQRPPKTPPNTPTRQEDRVSPTSPSGPGSLKSAMKKAAAVSQKSPKRKGLAVRFEIEEPSAATSPDDTPLVSIPSSCGVRLYSNDAVSALNVDWPTVPTDTANDYDAPRSSFTSFGYSFVSHSYIRSDELYTPGMVLPNGKAPALDDAPAPWSCSRLAQVVPGSMPSAIGEVRKQLRCVGKRSYPRLAYHRGGTQSQFSAVECLSPHLVGFGDSCSVDVTKSAKHVSMPSLNHAILMTWG